MKHNTIHNLLFSDSVIGTLLEGDYVSGQLKMKQLDLKWVQILYPGEPHPVNLHVRGIGYNAVRASNGYTIRTDQFFFYSTEEVEVKLFNNVKLIYRYKSPQSIFFTHQRRTRIPTPQTNGKCMKH